MNANFIGLKALGGSRQIAALTQEVDTHMAECATLRYSPESTEYSDIFSLSPNVVQGTMKGKLKGATHQNLVKNGNFADGTTGWSATGGTMSVSNGNLVFEASAVAEEHYVLQALPIPIAGHKYYFTAKNLANVEWSIIIYNFNGDGQYESVSSPTIQTAGRLSVCITPSSVNAIPYFFIRLYCKTGETANFNDVQVYDLTAEGLTNLTEDQLNQKFSHYIDGMQSVQPQEIKSVGKNLFPSDPLWDKEGTAVQITKIDGGYKIKGTSGEISRAHVNFKAKPNTNYVFQRRVSVISNPGGSTNEQITAWGFNNPDYSDLVAMATMHSEDNSMTFNTFGKNNFSITFYANWDGASTEFDLTDIQLEEGTTATPYEPYQESKAYMKYPLRSVPNGVADEVDLQSGKIVKRCEEYVLQASDISLSTSTVNVDIVLVKKPANYSGYNNMNANLGSFSVAGFNSIIGNANIDNVNYIGFVATHYLADRAYLIVAKGTYADLAAAQAALAGTKIVYQLAEPQVIEDALTNFLTVYPSGTVSNKAKKQYALPSGDITTLDTTLTSVDRVFIQFPNNFIIPSGTDNFGYGVATDRTIPLGGVSTDNVNNAWKHYVSTAVIVFIVPKGIYASLAEARADLAGTIITYDTKPELSTIPVTMHSEPINLAGAVKSESDRNTRQDEQINDITLLLDYLIVVNA